MTISGAANVDKRRCCLFWMMLLRTCAPYAPAPFHVDAPWEGPPYRSTLDGETVDDHKRPFMSNRRMPRPAPIHDQFLRRLCRSSRASLPACAPKRERIGADRHILLVVAGANDNDVARRGAGYRILDVV